MKNKKISINNQQEHSNFVSDHKHKDLGKRTILQHKPKRNNKCKKNNQYKKI